MAPVPDIYDQLLGAGATQPLAWSEFAHLGREAEVAARGAARGACRPRGRGEYPALRPARNRQDLLCRDPGRADRRPARPVCEADDDGDEPDRDQRLAGLRLAQRLAEPGRTVLLFSLRRFLVKLRFD